MSTSTGHLLRKGKPEYVRKSEEEAAARGDRASGSVGRASGGGGGSDRGPSASRNPPTNGRPPRPRSGSIPLKGGAPTGNGSARRRSSSAQRSSSISQALLAQLESTQRRVTPTAAARDSLYRHKEAALHIQALLQLTLRSRGQPPGGAGEDADVLPPPTPEEVRPVLDAIRDYCVAMNNKTKFEGGSVGASRSQLTAAGANDDDLNGFFAIVFLSTLFFANEAQELLCDSLQSAVDRLRAAEAHGREELYHNAVVEAVNHVLLFTPLTAPPVWLLGGERHTTAPSPAPRKRGGRVGDSHESMSMISTLVAANASASRRASVLLDATTENALDEVAAVVCELLLKMDQSDEDEDDEAGVGQAASDGAEEAGEDADAGRAMILEDDCIDYLSSDGGTLALDEQHWIEVWLSTLLEGYVHLTAAVLEEMEGGDAVGEGAGCPSIPTLLPRPVWRSFANNAYAQFAVQLLAIFFARGSDGSLNYCARVHKLVQYYHVRLRQGSSSGTCAPIPTRNAARPGLPPPRSVPRQRQRTPTPSGDADRATPQVPSTLPPRPPAPPVEAVEASSGEDEPGKGTKHVMLFHPSLERSRSRVRGRRDSSVERDTSEYEDAEEEDLEQLTGGFSRFHKCYTAAESPDVTGKRRIPVDADEQGSGDDDNEGDLPDVPRGRSSGHTTNDKKKKNSSHMPDLEDPEDDEEW